MLLTGGGDSVGVETTEGGENAGSTDQKIVETTTSVDVPPASAAEPAVTTTVLAQVIPTSVVTLPKPEELSGDLGLSQPMSKPPCDDTYITVVASAVNSDTNASVLTSVLERYPGSAYLKTSETCPSLRASLNGEDIYVAYFGPFLTSSEACAARSKGPTDAYVRILSLTVPDTHRVAC
jgi:serine/threonine-protein kinase